MAKDNQEQNNNIGSAILYFREKHQITQTRLSKGLCSVATLSRIESGERDADSLLLDALLERLGKTPNEFELILTDFDYLAYQSREEIKKLIREERFIEASDLLHEYGNMVEGKSVVHRQFVVAMEALLNELQGGDIHRTIELLLEAITSTVPDFKANRILDYYLSNSELNIIIDLVQRMIAAGLISEAKNVLRQILEYFDLHSSIEESDRLYPKLAVIAARFYMQEEDWTRSLEICDKGIEKNKGNRKLDYYGDLYQLKAQNIEKLHREKKEWIVYKKECIRLYLQAYHVFAFLNESTIAEDIMRYIQEEYSWEDTV